MNKHILVISQYFFPESFKINCICIEWVKRGYKVTVLTGIPNYPEGEFYNGYGITKKRHETWNGIEIIRIPIFARGKTSVGLLLNYVSFAASGFFWKLFTKLHPDIVFTFEVSPMTQALIGVWFAKRRSIPNYLYVQDLWPENVETVAGIKNKVVINAISKMVNYIYRNCNMIFATSPSFVQNIQRRVSDKQKVVYWAQYAEDFYYPREKKVIAEVPNNNNFKIVFTGNIGYAQGLDILPKTAKILKKQGKSDINFVIVGDGRYKEKLIREIEECSVAEMFTIIKHQPAEKIPDILAACDAAFISFMDSPLFEMTIPAKLQSYMACGMPIIASASGETKRIIEESECGMCCELGNPDGLAAGILKLKETNLKELSRNSRMAYMTNFDKKRLLDEMDAYFNN